VLNAGADEYWNIANAELAPVRSNVAAGGPAGAPGQRIS
jgi:hypothetical protein